METQLPPLLVLPSTNFTVYASPTYAAHWTQRHVVHVNCKFGNLREYVIFANSVKRYICDFRISRLRHDLPIPVTTVISLFREDFVFTKFRICEVSRIEKPREYFRIYSIIELHVCSYSTLTVLV